MAAKLVCVVLIMCTVAAAPATEAAITCGQVSKGLGPCIPYLRNAGPLTPACCAGVSGLNSAARTPADRRQACQCMKSAASSIKGINGGLAAGLPGKCGVSIPYQISPTTDCSRVG